MFLAGHPNHQLVFMRIWQIEPTYLTDAFRDFYEENNLNITRILDVAQDLKVCAQIVLPEESLTGYFSCLDSGVAPGSPPFRLCFRRCCFSLSSRVSQSRQMAGR
jgi:hypothetical protein